MAEIPTKLTKEEFIKTLEAEGWEVTDTKINETDFPNLVTLSDGTANKMSELIRIAPPAETRVYILPGARMFVYFGGAAEAGDYDRVAMTLLKVNSVEVPIDSGVYANFKQVTEEDIYRFKRGIVVVPGNRFRIKCNSSETLSKDNTKFSIDALIAQKKE